MNACPRCKGHGTEDEWEEQACQMCGGSGEAVWCAKEICWCHAICGRPSVAWDDGSPRCHRHDPETIKKVREQVAQAREKVS